MHPALLTDPALWSSVSAGQFYSCGLGLRGVARCWGDDPYGQLGVGGRDDQFTPVKVH